LERLALGPLFHQLFSVGCGSKSETGGPSTVTRTEQSNMSTDRQELQSDFIFPKVENPLGVNVLFIASACKTKTERAYVVDRWQTSENATQNGG